MSYGQVLALAGDFVGDSRRPDLSGRKRKRSAKGALSGPSK